MEVEKYYVYKTTNVENGKLYVGVHKSKDIENDPYLGSGYILYKAILKYGSDSFNREILYEFDTPEDAFKKEKEIVNAEFVLREDTYNIAIGGHGGRITEINPFFGKKHTQESLQKMSNSHKGFRHTEESKRKIGEGVKNSESYIAYTKSEKRKEDCRRTFLGKHLSDEHKAKISQNNKGKVNSEETRLKISIANKGQKRSKEFCEHLSRIHKGSKKPWMIEFNKRPEKIAKTAATHTGMKRSEQACENISKSLIGKFKGEESNSFIGWYITPYGKFDSLASASLAIGNSKICIRDRCRIKNNNKILLTSVLVDPKLVEPILTRNDVGKTWKLLGWGFEEANKKSEEI